MITNAGRVLLALMRNIPDGVVVFFPSYAYLNLCVSTWKGVDIADSDQTGETLWHRINTCKPVFMEAHAQNLTPHSQSTNVRNQGSETLLTSYSKAIVNSNVARGALLLSVINGSLSEGINFSDRLGRAVIVIGMPFPNPHSAEWKAKMEYIAQKTQHEQLDSGMGVMEAEKVGKAAAQDFYENATMRAVNQAIGRAIRHKDDYAAILLMDRRYGTEKIQKKLPGWIKESVRKPAEFQDITDGLKAFYAGRR
jgi:chromosome transmission fidelity protein 1